MAKAQRAKTDKRVYKTIKNLKQTLVALMKERPFDKINVKMLCERASTSRVTFYTYYDDKYDLLQDVFQDMNDSAAAGFRTLQGRNNPGNDFSLCLQNLLEAILASEQELFCSPEYLLRNTDTILFYYRFLTKNIETFEISFPQKMQTRYPVHQLNAFLAVGLWSFLHADGTAEIDPDSRQYAGRLIRDLVASDIFWDDAKAHAPLRP